MTLFKNGVGRPSNDTIKRRRIFYGACAFLLVSVLYFGYVGIMTLSGGNLRGISGDVYSITNGYKNITAGSMYYSEPSNTQYETPTTILFKLSQKYGSKLYYWIEGPYNRTEFRGDVAKTCKPISSGQTVSFYHKVNDTYDWDQQYEN